MPQTVPEVVCVESNSTSKVSVSFGYVQRTKIRIQVSRSHYLQTCFPQSRPYCRSADNLTRSNQAVLAEVCTLQ